MEFLCDTMRDTSYDDREDYYRHWDDIPQTRYSDNNGMASGMTYVIPNPSRWGPLTNYERMRIESSGQDSLAAEIGIYQHLEYTDNELRGLLDAHDYVNGNLALKRSLIK